MIICGVELTGTNAHVAVISGTSDKFSMVQTKKTKFSLEDFDDASATKAFKEAVHKFLKENKVEVVAVKKRKTSGQYAGGAMTFKMEGIFQLADGVEVKMFAPTSIAAKVKKFPPPEFDMHEYQKNAFNTAYAALS